MLRRKKTFSQTLILSIIISFLGRCAVIGILPKTRVSEEVYSAEKAKPLRYTLSVPSSYSNDKFYPLLVALHYGGEVTPYFGKGVLTVLVEPALSELRAIIVAPDCPAGQWDNPTSEAAVISLIADIEKRYRIDKRKILVTGYSLGAIGSWYLAARHPDVFSAAIPISGKPPENMTFVRIPVYAIHSRADKIFPFNEVKKKVQPLIDRGGAVRLMAVNGLSHYDTKRFVPSLKAAIPWIREVWMKPVSQ
jgi:predicted peptidase